MERVPAVPPRSGRLPRPVAARSPARACERVVRSEGSCSWAFDSGRRPAASRKCVRADASRQRVQMPPSPGSEGLSWRYSGEVQPRLTPARQGPPHTGSEAAGDGRRTHSQAPGVPERRGRGSGASPEGGPRHTSGVSKGGFGVESTFPAQPPETITIGTPLRLDVDSETSRTS